MAATCRRRHELNPCPAAVLAIEAMHAATIRLAPTCWMAEIGQQLKTGELDPVEAMAEALRRHRDYREHREPHGQ
jgi:hypothetical protein